MFSPQALKDLKTSEEREQKEDIIFIGAVFVPSRDAGTFSIY